MIQNETAAKLPLIMYADDDADDRLLMNLAISEWEHAVSLQIFEDGVLLLRHLALMRDKDVLPCLIILDINMPMLSGKDTLRIIRSIDYLKSVPVVLFTTSSAVEEKFFAKEFGAEFITKPLHLADMDAVLSSFFKFCTHSTHI